MTAYLFDTHLLLWSAAGDPRLPRRAAALIASEAHVRLFSPVSIAEIAIKWQQRRPDFQFAPARMRAEMLEEGYVELPLTSLHATRIADLSRLHGDPFDRLLVAQALAEGVPFVTADAVLAGYPGQIMVV
ncbi:type II toxin-antitoxin system VapC family toxin [Sphingomonas bacterium]|uniref:type II toxin-antitoxin system VapC family toxin n=1 Tax=Sphingomonas bacterium TaxID=1895847 RepID=UPI0015772796|nr:type II toxin-antitoxin system VapC family toxin [Sphingomonas bacterium]